jgi:hypothetical protein
MSGRFRTYHDVLLWIGTRLSNLIGVIIMYLIQAFDIDDYCSIRQFD